jgi:large subunit ribosomal protein L21
MYAVVKTGGKQYRVAENDVIRVEKLDLEAGSKVKLDNVLLIGDDKKITVGAPLISGASVEATVVEQMRDRKVIIFKKIRRHNYRRKKGHRQHLTVLKVNKIVAGK